MQCPQCHYLNPASHRFCGQCGHKLVHICPQCHSENTPQNLYCSECGHALPQAAEAPPQDLTVDNQVERLQRYLPTGLAEKILAQKDRIEGELKQVTVMFCDMVGFTRIAEELGPEIAYGVMDEIYEILIRKVHELEGTVNEMTGDGIMALFGAPIAQEDAPQRAIRASLAIHRELAKFNERMQTQQTPLPLIRMRIGIHTGQVVVGTLGNDLRVEFKAVGDTVNLASRMETLAQPGTTYVTEATYNLAEGLFRFEALGAHQLKGKSDAVQVYRVIAPSRRRTRFDVSAERGLTPFVGRATELELLFDGLERARAGRGQIFGIVAEAGVGKSRLLYEFHKTLENENITYMEGKCLSFSKGIAYHPVIDILKSNFDIQEGDADERITDKVKNGLNRLGIPEAQALPFVLELLSVKDSGIEAINLSSEGKRDRIVETLKRIVAKGSEIRPLVLAIEDLHWIDRSSEAVLHNLMETIPSARVLMVLTYRPEYTGRWDGKSYHNHITLNRLSNRNAGEMINYLLDIHEPEGLIEALVLEKTEGVPFFIEEFVKSLKDLKIIEKHQGHYRLTRDMLKLTVPISIHDVIMARVDSLPHGPKEVLQIGSVIEREFSYPLIHHITELPQSELLADLDMLKKAELLYERGIYPQTTYIFRHALTREVVYEAILARKRQSLHAKVGEAIEALHPEAVEDNLSILAHHFNESAQYQKAAEYYKRAGKKAEKTASLNEAIAYARLWVEALERLGDDASVQQEIIDARTALGLYTSQTGRLGEARAAIAAIMDRALAQENKKRLSQLYIIEGTHAYMFAEDFPLAFQSLSQGLRISEEVEEIIATVLANYYLGVAYTFNCQFEPACRHIEQAHEINHAFKNLWGMSVMASHLALPCNYQGLVADGYRHSARAVRLAEESGDIFSKAMAYTLHGFSCHYYGQREAAIEHLQVGAALGERMNYFAWNAVTHFYLAETLFEMRSYALSQSYYEKAIWFLEKNIWFPSFLNLNRIALVRAQVFNTGRGGDLDRLFPYAEGNRLKLFDGKLRRYLGEILMAVNADLEAAGAWLDQALDCDTAHGELCELGEDHAALARLKTRQGDSRGAGAHWEAALDCFQRCGVDERLARSRQECRASTLQGA